MFTEEYSLYNQYNKIHKQKMYTFTKTIRKYINYR